MEEKFILNDTTPEKGWPRTVEATNYTSAPYAGGIRISKVEKKKPGGERCGQGRQTRTERGK